MGTLFFAFSLTPSLIPRSTLFQGIVSGCSLAIGYALGVVGRWLWHYLELPVPSGRARRRAELVAAATCTAVAAGFLWRASGWQDSLRVLVAMEPVEHARPVSVALIALLLFLVARALARLFRRVYRLLSRLLKRFVPRRLAHVLGVAAAAVLFWSVVEGVVFSAALRAADASFREVDALIPDDVAPPTDSMKSGSPASLIAWHDLGKRGRAFVTAGPTAHEIGAFVGAAAPEPIRIYVGLNAAPTPQARARLALREMIRVGAFARSVLVLVTPTGTGWVDPAALDPVEFLHRGDIASVAAQYSYLPSPLALIAEDAYGAETAAALFEEVYGYWTRLPPGDRPRLYLFGLSLGALDAEGSFHLHDVLADPFQGALWAGPPFRSETWRSVTADRDSGSTAWLPRYRNGAVVRFMNQHGGLGASAARWGPLRIAYLQYASDPITFFDVRSAFRQPDWMRPPRGPDVSPALRWYPIVTMLQLAADMAAGAGATPPGFGHNFAVEHYIDAWVALTEP
ncbi:MAG TPA: alpha/beta-hydrolase family protein, partial [Gemmatirosa sp.]|nr:alpha/beta-hydrolase family protein [Gemmatirosa sp.]